MKKLFTFLSRANKNSVGVKILNVSTMAIIAMVMMLLVPSGARAGEYIYFTECPQLDYGTTSFDYTSVTVKYHAESSRIPLTYNTPVNEVCDINSSEFSNASVGDKIRVNFTGSGNFLQYKYHGTYTDFTDLNNTKSWGTNYVEATISDQNVLNILQRGGQDIQAGLNIQAASGYTVTSIELIRESSATPPTGYTWTATPHAGISIKGGYSSESGGVYTLNNPSGFTFEGSGYIVITCTANNGMKASYLITVLEENQKRHWDFTKHQLVVGPYNDKAWRLANDSQWEFKKYNPDNNNEDVYRYKGSINASNAGIVAELNGGNDKNLWLNEGDPSNKNLGKNKLSIRNEPTPPERVNEGIKYSLNRYIAVEPGVTLKITGLQKGDKVRMLLDKYGDDMELTFSNAQDVLGNNISGVYKVGGSSDTSEGKYSLGSYYNFIVAENGTFEMTQTKNTCYVMKIYDIEVYRGDFKQSNEILSYKKKLKNSTKEINGYSLVNGYQCIANYDVSPAMQEQDLSLFDAFYYLHHRGKDETVCEYEIIKTSHNLNLTKDDFDLPWRSGGSKYYKDRVSLKTETKNMIYNNQIFGSFILRIKLYDANQTYITDYADRIISIGYIEKVNHPITWDFTDLKQYVEKADYLLKETDYADNNAHLDLSIWKKDGNDWRLDYNRYNPNGAPFAWGTQLYAGTKMFDETRGIGFAPINNNVSTSSLKITDDGLRIEDPQTNGGWEMSIHEIDGLAAVYIRYEPIEGKDPVVRCEYNRAIPWGEDKPSPKVIINKDVDGNEKIQAHSAMIIWDHADGEEEGRGCTNEFKIYMNNVILKKIGTSKDQKKISKPGYATESRLRDIDHSLTAYFTGLPIEAYTGYLPAEGDYSKVVLKRIDNDENHKVLPASTASTEGVEPSNTGCILYNNVDIDETNGKSTVAGLDGGIHLFVPDMHDVDKKVNVNDVNSDGSNHKNVMLSFKPTYNYFTFADQDKDDPENYIYMEDEGKLTFLLSAKKYAYGTNGETVTPGYDVYFVRVDPNAKRKIRVQNGTDQGGNPTYKIVTDDAHPGYAYLTRNCAYIRVPKDKVKELTSGGSTGNAKVSFIFEDELFGEINNGIATGIDQVTSNKSQVTSAEWYNLNGQKLNGMPTEKGLYIVNGRKVLVK